MASKCTPVWHSQMAVVSPRRLSLVVLLLPLASVSFVNAFVGPHRPTSPVGVERFVQATGSDIETDPNASIHSQESHSDREVMQRDIADLQQKASKRLDALMEQMEELQKLNEQKSLHSKPEAIDHSNEAESALLISPKATKPVEVTGSTDLSLDSKHVSSESHAHRQVDEHKSTTTTTVPVVSAPFRTEGSLDLLDGTVWKIVFSIGREAGTWMPKDWAVSGDRLYYQCTVQFSDQKLPIPSSGDDSFFQGSVASNSGAPKILKVTDTFIMPCPGARTGREAQSTNVFLGRRPLPVLPMGAYKVCRGQGPAGTDLLRFYIQLTEGIANYDDVSCPKGRIYGTCGYFASTVATPDAALLASVGANVTSYRRPMRVRDVYQQQHDEAVRTYTERQVAVETDEHAVWHPEHWRLVHAAWQAKEVTQTTAAQLQTARMREPERSKLRFTPKDDVALTAEGGVCYKVHQGLALEYHILGRLQVACIAQESTETKSEATTSK